MIKFDPSSTMGWMILGRYSWWLQSYCWMHQPVTSDPLVFYFILFQLMRHHWITGTCLCYEKPGLTYLNVLKSSVNTLRERVWLKRYTFLKMIHGLLYLSYRGRCAKEYWFSFQSQTILDLVWGYYPIIFFTFLLGTLKKRKRKKIQE